MSSDKIKVNNYLFILINFLLHVDILNRSVIKIDKFCFIGTILWSNCPEDKEFPKYRVKIHGFNKQKYNKFNNYDINFLKTSIEMCNKNNCIPIVITHYPASTKLLNKAHKKDGFEYLYANDLEYLLDKSKVPLWICGHTHWSFDLISNNGTRLIGNQKGTKTDSNNNYSKEYVINIE